MKKGSTTRLVHVNATIAIYSEDEGQFNTLFNENEYTNFLLVSQCTSKLSVLWLLLYELYLFKVSSFSKYCLRQFASLRAQTRIINQIDPFLGTVLKSLFPNLFCSYRLIVR